MQLSKRIGNLRLLSYCLVCLTMAVSACGGDSNSPSLPPTVDLSVPIASQIAGADFTLQLLHVADMDGGGDLITNSKAISAMVEKFRAELPNNTLFVSSGDNWIPGPFYFAADDSSMTTTLGKRGVGRADIAILNAMGLQASTFGNHEFDQGSGGIASAIKADGDFVGAKFAYLSSNLDFSSNTDLSSLVAPDGQELNSIKGKIAKYAVITLNGQKIGIIGATTPKLPIISSPGTVKVLPQDSDNIDALAAQIQPYVDELTSQGVNKIILLAHMQQISIEKALADKLTNVDIIVAGGSNTRMLDTTDALYTGDSVQESYPYTSPINKTLVVNVDGDYKYLGRLVVGFDAQGRILHDKLEPRLNGGYATTASGLARVSLTIDQAIAKVKEICDAVFAVFSSKESTITGASTVFMNGERFSVRRQETNLGNLSADANLWYAQKVDESTAISLKNGGGIRGSMGTVYVPPGSTDASSIEYRPPAAKPEFGKQAGDISRLDIETVLRFNNGLTLLSVTGTELKALLEHGLSSYTSTSTAGAFPQVGGMQFSFDPSQPAGSRVRSLKILDNNGAQPGGNAVVVVQNGVVIDNQSVRLVTLDFLANGGDGYPFSSLSAPNRLDIKNQTGVTALNNWSTWGTEQDAFAAYLKNIFPRSTPFAVADTPDALDKRIQNLSVRSDTVLD